MYIPRSRSRHNILAYLLWRWIFQKNGSFLSGFDAFFFGPSRGMNDYESLAGNYTKSNVKPDKLYSILPSVLKMVGDCNGKTAIDIGCGGGFFTRKLAECGVSRVWGIDNSLAQIELAREVSSHPSVSYVRADAFIQYSDTQVDIVAAPFVVNYARTVPILKHFFGLIHKSLKLDGKAVFVVDLPNGKSLKRFGAVKTLLGPHRDETAIRIDLFSEEKKICELRAVYYTPETIERLLRETGFRNICWHKPVVSEEGIRVMGADFWEGYRADPELGYLTAEK